MLQLKPCHAKIPPFEVHDDFENQEDHREVEEELDAGVEARLHNGVLILPATVSIDVDFLAKTYHVSYLVFLPLPLSHKTLEEGEFVSIKSSSSGPSSSTIDQFGFSIFTTTGVPL